MRAKRQKGAGKTGALGKLELPEKLQPVTLAQPSGERIPARVAEREADSLALVVMVVLDPPLRARRLDGLVLEFETDRGRIGLSGSVTIEHDDTLRMRDLRVIDVVQRRQYVRAWVDCQVLVSLGPGRAQAESKSIDISGSGIRLVGPKMLKVGDRVFLQITIASLGVPVKATGTVVRTGSREERAITFEAISEVDQRRLIRFVFECLRAERNRGLKF